jgi:hypothetical protein
MVRHRGPPSQTWRTFLRNHADAIAAIDLCVVPTLTFERLFAFLVVGHSRRQLLWFALTGRPTAEWLAQQIVRHSRGIPHRYRELLALDLQELSIEPNFDITVTGFETAEIDLLINELNEGAADEADEIPEINCSIPAVSRPGDRWRIGEHFLLCGDALSKNSYGDLLGAHKAQMVFTDPPYNVAIARNVSGLGKVKHREFAMASGEMSPHEYATFLATTFMHLTEFSTNGSIHFICIDWRHIRDLLEAAVRPYSELRLFVFGRRPTPAWAVSTARSTS